MELPYPKPAGEFVVLPTEPTTEMLNAYDEARAATTMHPPGSIKTYNPHQSYWALLNAAPANKELERLREIERAAMALSTAMVESEAKGAVYHLVDDEWMWLSAVISKK